MKKFIFKILFLLLPLAIFAIFLEVQLRNIPNDYAYKNAYLNQNAEKIQTLILGSSHAFLDINPIYFSQNTFNASHVSQSLDFDLKIFEKYQNRFNNLKTIILPVSYFTLWSRLEHTDEYWRIKDYVLYYDLHSEHFDHYFELLNGELKTHWHRFYQYFFKKTDDIHCTELGWGTQYDVDHPGKNLQRSGKERTVGHEQLIIAAQNTNAFTENVKILNTFAEICAQKNIRLILLTPPVYRTYSENLNPKYWSQTLKIVNAIDQKYSHCDYFNWLKSGDFTDKDFYDADHLNANGTQKISLELAKIVEIVPVKKNEKEND